MLSFTLLLPLETPSLVSRRTTKVLIAARSKSTKPSCMWRALMYRPQLSRGVGFRGIFDLTGTIVSDIVRLVQ